MLNFGTNVIPQSEVPTASYITGTRTFDTAQANGLIDESFNQGRIGDCALLASLWSLSQLDEGAQAIYNALDIVKDETGNITGYDVTFAGTEETYHVSQEELTQAITNDGTRLYSYGDDDVTVLELALEKAFAESEDEMLRYLVDNYTTREENCDYLKGVNPASVTYLLTGESADWLSVTPNGTPALAGRYVPNVNLTTTDLNGNEVTFENGVYYKLSQGKKGETEYISAKNPSTGEAIKVEMSKFLNEIFYPSLEQDSKQAVELFNNYQPNSSQTLVFATTTNGAYQSNASQSGETLCVKVKGADGSDIELYAPHAYAVKEVKDGIVTLINPHNTGKPIQVQQESLLSLEKFYIYNFANEQQTEEAQEPTVALY